MKTIITLFLISTLASCTPGRWVAGNAKSFQKRHDAKEMRKAKTEFVKNI